MRMIFDFECKKDGLFEELVDSKVKKARCPKCGGTGIRQIAAPRIDWRKMGLDPGFPSAYEKWGKAKRVHHATDKGMLHGGKAHNLSMY